MGSSSRRAAAKRKRASGIALVLSSDDEAPVPLPAADAPKPTEKVGGASSDDEVATNGNGGPGTKRLREDDTSSEDGEVAESAGGAGDDAQLQVHMTQKAPKGEAPSSDEDGQVAESQSARVAVPVVNLASDSDEGEVEETPDTVTKLKDDDSVIEVSSDEEGEVDGNAAQRKMFLESMKSAKQVCVEVKEHNVRFFNLGDVVCARCGMIGHLSSACTETVVQSRCFKCGTPGCDSWNCKQQRCHRCNQLGHIARDCTTPVSQLPKVTKRFIEQPRAIKPLCYVCGSREHADCSLFEVPRAALSCANCGMPGHTRHNCREKTAERWVSIVSQVDQEQKNAEKKKKLNVAQYRAEVMRRVSDTSGKYGGRRSTGQQAGDARRRSEDGGGGGNGSNGYRKGRGGDDRRRSEGDRGSGYRRGGTSSSHGGHGRKKRRI